MPKGIHAQQNGFFCNEFILKIKSHDNRLMNKKVAVILSYGIIFA